MLLRPDHALSNRRNLRGVTLAACALLMSSAACLTSATALAATTDAPVAPAVTATTPKLLGPAVFAARPASPLVYKVAAVGQAPLTFAATGIPTGLAIAADTGVISGTMPAAGSYTLTLTVTNSLGSASRSFKLVSGDTLAQTPPMGWNSYDSFGGGVTETEVLAAAEAQKAQLQPYGWNYVVVDYLWFDNEQAVDSNGRYLPSKSRFPSATGTLGFKPLADKIHAMGLNFGIHIMRGIPRKTVSSNPTIAGSTLKAADAGNTGDPCPWDTHMWGVKGNTAAGQAWYDSIFAQYAEWGIDFVKVDDLLNNQAAMPYPYHQAEVDAIRKAIDKTGRSIVLSLSPGPMKTSDVGDLTTNANMWRMVNDFWDKSGLSNLSDVFNASGSWQGTPNIGVGHWPDGDMLPLGYIGPRSPVGGAARTSALTHNEQVSVMSLWSILPSPLIFGGNVPKLTSDASGPFTLALLTNDEIIAVDQDSAGNKGKRISSSGDQQIWTKDLSGGRKAVAFFNRGNADVAMSATLTQLGVSAPLTARDLWQRKDLAAPTTSVNVNVPYKGAAMILLSPPAAPEGGAGGGGGSGVAGAPGASGTSGAASTDGGTAGTESASGAAGLASAGAGNVGTVTAGAGGAPPVGTSGAPSTTAGASGSNATPPSNSADSGGCSCRVGTAGRPLHALWLLAAAALAYSRRRRSRFTAAGLTMARHHLGVLGLVLSVAACGSSSDAPPANGGSSAGVGGAAAAGASSAGTSGTAVSAGAPPSAGAGSGNATSAGATGSSGATAVAGGSSDVGGAPSAGASGAGGSAAGAAGSVPVVPAGTAWDSPSTGNPFLPGYFADPSIFYDASSSTFYVFSTTDGVWIDYSADPTVWSSKDFVNWHAQRLSLPAAWPKQPLWAPSVMRHPTNGNYYLLYAIGSATYVARATTPLGPWTNATANGAPLYKKGEMFGSSDWFDAQFFVDTDATYMTFGGGGQVGIAKLAFASDSSVSIDNSDARMTNGSTHKFKQLTGVSNYLEGSCMFKSGTRYFITYSNSACQNYNVQYAVASSPLGPFTHANGNIVKREDTKHILGPGHNSVLQYNNDTYLVYHRQPYQYVDVKRQVSIDHITVNGDTISANAQTQSGVWAGSGALESLVAKARAASELDLAYGKATAASSESDFQGGTSGNIKENFAAIKGFYAAKFAVDNNRGTRWAPTTLPGSLVVDLGRDSSIGRTEVTFEYVLRAYHYRIEYLAQAEAPDLAAAKAATTWHSYADRSTNTTALPPMVDVNAATARYLRLTVISADLPTAQAEVRTIVETDFSNRVSVVEFKAFQNAAAPTQQ